LLDSLDPYLAQLQAGWEVQHSHTGLAAVAGDIPGKASVGNVDFEDMVGFVADSQIYGDHMMLVDTTAAESSTADPDMDMPCCPAAVMGDRCNKGEQRSDGE
jgi:hypothetical protein